MPNPFHFHDKILVLRYARLGHTPPARYETEILYEHDLPLIVVEFGTITDEKTEHLLDPMPKIRLQGSWQSRFPRPLRAFLMIAHTLFWLAKTISREGRPRLIIAHGHVEEFLAFCLHHLFRANYVVHVHEIQNVEDVKGSLLRVLLFALQGPVLRAADFLIFPEKTRADIYRRRYQLTNPIKIVYNCARLQPEPTAIDLKAQLGIPVRAKLVGYFGGIGRSNLLLESITSLQSLPDTHLLIWGWGDEAFVSELKQIAGELGLSSRVHFLGQLNEDKWRMIKSLDASLCLYRPDVLRLKYSASASNKLMESIALGVPAVTSDAPDYRAFSEGMDLGVSVKSTTPDGIRDALRQLFQDSESWKRKSTNARLAYQESLNYEAQFAPVLQDIQNCL